MNAYRLSEVAIGGAVIRIGGELVEVGGRGCVAVDDRVGVEVDAPCSLEISVSGRPDVVCACTARIPRNAGIPITAMSSAANPEWPLLVRILLLSGQLAGDPFPCRRRHGRGKGLVCIIAQEICHFLQLKTQRQVRIFKHKGPAEI